MEVGQIVSYNLILEEDFCNIDQELIEWSWKLLSLRANA